MNVQCALKRDPASWKSGPFSEVKEEKQEQLTVDTTPSLSTPDNPPIACGGTYNLSVFSPSPRVARIETFVEDESTEPKTEPPTPMGDVTSVSAGQLAVFAHSSQISHCDGLIEQVRPSFF